VFSLQIVNGETNLNIAIAIQEMWRQHLNIRMEINGQEWKSWLQTRATMDFEMSTGSWYADYIDPGNFFDLLRADSDNNYTGWHNADYDKLLDSANTASEAHEREALLEKANIILAKEMPVIPLFQPMNNNLVHPSVRGWLPDAAGVIRYQNLELKK
jgi:oligopeptide transport system substrate-binding protein